MAGGFALFVHGFLCEKCPARQDFNANAVGRHRGFAVRFVWGECEHFLIGALTVHLLVGKLLAEALYASAFFIHRNVPFSVRSNCMALIRFRKADVAGLLCLTG